MDESIKGQTDKQNKNIIKYMHKIGKHSMGESVHSKKKKKKKISTNIYNLYKNDLKYCRAKLYFTEIDCED